MRGLVAGAACSGCRPATHPPYLRHLPLHRLLQADCGAREDGAWLRVGLAHSPPPLNRRRRCALGVVGLPLLPAAAAVLPLRQAKGWPACLLLLNAGRGSAAAGWGMPTSIA